MFNYSGLHYCIPDLKWSYKIAIQTLNYLKIIERIYAITTPDDWENGGINAYINYTTISHLEVLEGIKQCVLFIDNVSKHMIQHREKMIQFLPRLIGNGIDCNIATIMYDFCL